MTLVLYVCMGQGHNSRSKGQIHPMLNRRLARTRTVRGAVATAVWTISVLYSLWLVGLGLGHGGDWGRGRYCY